MNTVEALHVLEQVRKQYTATGADHDIIREAQRVVTVECSKPDVPEVNEFPSVVED